MVNAPPPPRPYDIIVFGATGFTGEKTAIYLANASPADLKWAISGRSRGKLEDVRRKVLETGRWKEADVGVVVADSGDKDSIDAMVSQARVIISTIGPYSKYGTPVVDACVRFGTDYVDITGETPWIRKMIDAYHTEAKNKGIIIVPSCGFDSVPSDLTALVAANHLYSTLPSHPPTKSVKLSVVRMAGGVSGGTLNSIAGLMDEGANKMVEMATDPYYLNDAAGE